MAEQLSHKFPKGVRDSHIDAPFDARPIAFEQGLSVTRQLLLWWHVNHLWPDQDTS
jgi:hypothetical protein